MRNLKIKSREFIQGQTHQRKLDESYIKQKIQAAKLEASEEIAGYKQEVKKVKKTCENEKVYLKTQHSNSVRELKTQHKKEIGNKDAEISRIYKEYNEKKSQLDKDNQRYKSEMEAEYKKKQDELDQRRGDLEDTIERWESECDYLDQCTVDLYNIERLVEANTEPFIKAAVRLVGPVKESILKMRDTLKTNRKKVLKSGARIHRINHD